MLCVNLNQLVDRSFGGHLFAFTRPTGGELNHTVLQAPWTNGDPPWQTDQIHGRELATGPLFAVIVQRIKTCVDQSGFKPFTCAISLGITLL